MDLRSGLQIEEPRVFVPWGIDEAQLRQLLPAAHEVNRGYHVLDVVSLGGLQSALGFHFDPRADGRLVELEFFRRHYDDLAASFDEFQRHLESTFGPPQRTGEGDEGFPSHEWVRDGTSIRHYVVERFGPEEHVRIRRS
jgi:hypothetical protein